MNYESWTDEDVSLQTYFNEIASSQPLSREKEAELAERIAAGDDRAREELAEANLLFVVTVAKQYRNRGLSFSELISAGNVGLITAAERFDETRGFKFISYAVWWVRQMILQTLMEQSTVRVPPNRIDLLSKISRTIEALQKDGERTSLETVAAALDCSVEVVEQTMISVQPVRSLDAPFDSTQERCLLDCVCEEQRSVEDEIVGVAM